MEELKEFFKDIKRIADGIETIVKMNEKELKDIAEATCNCLNAQYNQLQQPVQAPVETVPQATPVSTAIPVSNAVQTYTQDQLAVAMGRALDSGKGEMIRNILGMFNVSSLMELKPEQYNDLALRLKEIGVDV